MEWYRNNSGLLIVALEGECARDQNIALDGCPYVIDADDGRAWRDGWQKRDAEIANRQTREMPPNPLHKNPKRDLDFKMLNARLSSYMDRIGQDPASLILWLEGMDARDQRIGLDRNPYAINGPSFNTWRDGWCARDKELYEQAG